MSLIRCTLCYAIKIKTVADGHVITDFSVIRNDFGDLQINP